VAGLLDLPGRLWALGRTVEELLKFQGQTREVLEAVDRRLRALEDRMIHLEAGQTHLVTEARAASSAAASAVAGAMLSDVVTRLTRMEMRAEETARRLPPPNE